MENIGRYRIERVLGSGTFATVWLGRDDDLNADVAIKVLADNWVHDEEVRRRFLEEARILWRAESPNIVRIHHIDVLEDGRPYIVMALADQGSLEDRMRDRALNRRQFTVTEAVDTGLAIATGLNAAHALDIVHRDLKPSAVLYQSIAGSDEPQLVLADFGIAKSIAQSKTTVATGTPHYMAPEQAEGRVDQRTDIYSAAVIMYEMLAGRVPYAFDSLTEVIRAQATAPPTSIELLRPDTPPALAAAIGRALSQNPDDRFGSVEEWADALRSSSPSPSVPDTSAAAPPMAATMGVDEFNAAMAAQQSDHPEPAVPTPPTVAGVAGGGAAAAPPPPPPPSPPPPTPPSVPSPPPPPPPRRKKSVLLPLIGLLVVVGVAVGALVLLTGGQEDGPDITEVFAEPVASTGIDPFTPTLVPQSFDIPSGDDGTIARIVDLLNPPVGSLSEIDFPDFDFPGIDIPQPTLGGVDPVDAVDAVVTTVSGAAPGLYGGTEILNTCNRDALIGFMTENLDKATAWAGVQGIDVADIPNFIGSLTDVILQVDTRVVNHGFRGGVANPINSVLQAGTAVLVDTFGIPRVRCYCGNPLAPAIALATDVTVLGNPWQGFDLGSAVVIQAIEEVLGFDLEDILGPLRFVKRVGSVVTTPATPSTTSTVPAITTTTTTIELGTGDVQATLRWTGDADLDLHVIDPEGVEIFFFNARSPSGGELDVDMQPACGTSSNNVENVFWPEGGSIPGEYQVFVVHFADTLCSQPGAYVLELKIDGVVVASDSGTLGVGEQSAPISATGG